MIDEWKCGLVISQAMLYKHRLLTASCNEISTLMLLGHLAGEEIVIMFFIHIILFSVMSISVPFSLSHTVPGLELR